MRPLALMTPPPTDRETVYFRNTVGSVVFHSVGYVRLAWSAERITLPELQAFYEQALTLLIGVGVGRILSEHGQRQPLSVAAQQWLVTDWIPRAIRLAGVHHVAIVEGQNPVHRLSTQGVLAAAPAGMQFRRFEQRPEAEAWLLTQPRG
ncbi:STAS/SEC14 domain-containing protein [Hymenobacter gummosus]|uniref:STAS/SEC14 domain-containing protein n=1 Tax=Hymenobacter gummosus TaxID=1776032 RepID=A0A3S0JAB2_9BACT|nr:STAS/SEC14 domain-containing protein [Hymenobacter gummosus]RTQ49762.1 STAS/SEC14 domain-containing protein [Hymenobacter gummosus]